MKITEHKKPFHYLEAKAQKINFRKLVVDFAILLFLVVVPLSVVWLVKHLMKTPPAVTRTAPVEQTTTSAPNVTRGEDRRVERSPTVRVSWYGEGNEECLGCSADRRMANGEIFNEDALTAACPSNYDLGDLVTLRYRRMSITVECTDRFDSQDVYFDLSKAAFQKLVGSLESGIALVELANMPRRLPE